MPRITVTLTEEEYKSLEKLAEEQKRTPKAQAEWVLSGGLQAETGWREVQGARGVTLPDVLQRFAPENTSSEEAAQ